VKLDYRFSSRNVDFLGFPQANDH